MRVSIPTLSLCSGVLAIGLTVLVVPATTVPESYSDAKVANPLALVLSVNLPLIVVTIDFRTLLVNQPKILNDII